MATRVTATASCRADLAGGTLDIWPLGLLHAGAVTVNVALDLAVRVSLGAGRDTGYRVRQDELEIEAPSLAELASRPDAALVAVVLEALAVGPVTVELRSGSPRGAGLGASSAMTVALIAAAEALLGRPASSAAWRAALARDLEARLMGLPTGLQDHYPALLGGCLALEHEPGGERVRRLEVDLEALGQCLLVVFTGQGHFSASQNWQVVRGRLDGRKEMVALFDGLAEVAAAVPDALEAGDFAAVGQLMDREWALRRELAAGISTPAIEQLLSVARSLGAWGGRACGAGGGGSIALLAPPAVRPLIARHLEAAGGRVLAAAPSAAALAVEVWEA